MKSLIQLSCLFLVIGCWSLDCQQPNKKYINPKNPIKIGILALYQGPGYRFLTDLHRGLDLAFSDAGDFHLIYENSDTTTPHGKMAIEKLIKKDQVLAIFGGDDLHIVKKMAAAAEKNQVLYFPTLLTVPEEISHNPYVFCNTPSSEDLTQMMIDFCRTKFHGKNYSLIYQEDSYHISIANLLRDSLNNQDFEVLHFNDHLVAPDPGALNKSDIVFLLTNHETTIHLLDDLRSAGIEKPVIGGVSSIRHPNDQLLEDRHFYYPRISIKENGSYFRKLERDFEEFHHKITVRFPELFQDEPNLFEAQAYEAAKLLIEAILQAGTDSNEIGQYLLTSKFNSLTGSLGFNQWGQVDRDFEMVHLVQGSAEVAR